MRNNHNGRQGWYPMIQTKKTSQMVRSILLFILLQPFGAQVFQPFSGRFRWFFVFFVPSAALVGCMK
jgi:hypothetical protein